MASSIALWSCAAHILGACGTCAPASRAGRRRVGSSVEHRAGPRALRRHPNSLPSHLPSSLPSLLSLPHLLSPPPQATNDVPAEGDGDGDRP